jgi:hypothetical protein
VVAIAVWEDRLPLWVVETACWFSAGTPWLTVTIPPIRVMPARLMNPDKSPWLLVPKLKAPAPLRQMQASGVTRGFRNEFPPELAQQ